MSTSALTSSAAPPSHVPRSRSKPPTSASAALPLAGGVTASSSTAQPRWTRTAMLGGQPSPRLLRGVA
eukprot:3830647-Prymnesium_polylepis.1